MLRRLLGYMLTGIGLLSFMYFRAYSGTTIPYTTVWFCLSIVVAIYGFNLIITSKSRRQSKQEKFNKEQLDKLKKNGEMIFMTLDNCEIKANNYYEDKSSEETFDRVKAIDSLFDSNRNYKENHVEQSAILYYYISGNNKIRMASQTFPISGETLHNRVKNKMVVLYLDKADKNNYEFELG